MGEIGEAFERLVEIMRELRGEHGCPWDKEQTHESLRQYLLEEAYEVIEAIDSGRYDDLKEELGDLLLQVVFHAQIGEEEGRFTILDVIKGINDKLVRRHPHVFGDVVVKTAAEQSQHWEKLKRREGKKSAIDGVPKSLNALLRAHRVQAKAATVGFDWEKTEQVWEKVREELGELEEAYRRGDQEAIQEELGDVLFAIVNLSRFLHVNPEDALRLTVDKFSRRFRAVEEELRRRGKSAEEADLEEMDAIWENHKRLEKELKSQQSKKE
ncbi:MAG: nucleoside triphosphate pyrophosphohydrolase [Calditrichaeota bacterium]|nr:nucleoside triphosphate pyrophosphohydrolase [Calditrichota bacterium]